MTAIPTLSADFTKTYSFDLPEGDRRGKEFLWEIGASRLFEELILSWNGKRPEKGKWMFWVSVHQGSWSPWIRYAEWGAHSQKTFKYAPQGSFVESYQDFVYPKDGQCDGFRIKVTAEEGADLSRFDTLYVCLSALSSLSIELPTEPLTSKLLSNVPRRSQIQLKHPRAQDLCSPTSTATAINYLLGRKKVDPVEFAAKSHDDEFDIYGNWILNTAQAYHELSGQFRCRVERLPSFSFLHSYLMRNLPVVVSIRGPLPGSSRPHTFGHLICIVGYDSGPQKVLCIDPGFPDDEQTFVGYFLKDFLEAWNRRRNIAYLFEPKNLQSTLAKIMLNKT